MAKSLDGCTAKSATGCAVVAFVCVLVAFVSPNWLQTDGTLDRPKFVKIGLWQACFNGYNNIRNFYDTRNYGCWWVFDEDYYSSDDALLPDFYIATQFFFSACTSLLIIGSSLAILCRYCSRQHEKYRLLLWATGSILTLAAVCGIAAVTVFSARGDYRDWMPNWEHNDLGWSYALAVLGSFTLLAAGLLFITQARRFRKKTERMLEEY